MASDIPSVEQLENDLRNVLKSRNLFVAGVLRLLLSSLHNKSIEKRSQGKDSSLIDEDVLEVLQKEAKKRKEAMVFYEKGGRKDLLEKEQNELKIIESYLPAQLSEEEIKKIVETAISQSGVATEKDFGKVMGLAMKELKGKADAAAVSRLIKEKLAKNESR